MAVIGGGGGGGGLSQADLDNILNDTHVVVMDTVADTAGVLQNVGFQVNDFKGVPVTFQVFLEFAIFDESTLATPSTRATLANAITGSILGGSGTAALRVETDAAGRFLCECTKLSTGLIAMACSVTFGSKRVDCASIDTFLFQP